MNRLGGGVLKIVVLNKRRALLGLVMLLTLVLLLVVLPLWAMGYAHGLGLSSGIPIWFIMIGGTATSLVTAVTWLARPSRIYGPLRVLSSGVITLYIFLLSGLAIVTYTLVSGGKQVTASVNLGNYFLLLLMAPALGIVSGLFIALQDSLFPEVRTSKEFPKQ